MKTVGMFDAKTRFSELVSDAVNGETTTITKNGKPVAEISPVRSDDRERVREVLERIRRHGEEIRARNGSAISADEIVRWINEGRKY